MDVLRSCFNAECMQTFVGRLLLCFVMINDKITYGFMEFLGNNVLNSIFKKKKLFSLCWQYNNFVIIDRYRCRCL